MDPADINDTFTERSCRESTDSDISFSMLLQSTNQSDSVSTSLSDPFCGEFARGPLAFALDMRSSVPSLSSIYESNKKEEVSEGVSSLSDLPMHLLLYQTLSFLRVSDIVSFASTCHKFRKLIFSKDAEHLWNDPTLSHGPIELCIDSYCSICSLTKRIGTVESAYSIMSTCPSKNLRMHCFITDIPICLESIGRMNIIEKLHLQLTNQSNSPSLEALLLSSQYLCDSIKSDNGQYKYLSELILDSSHLQHINCRGRELLLKILGRSLTSLSFIGLSPSGAFRVVRKHCPKLKQLRIDRAISPDDLISYSNDRLESLELCRAGFVLPPIRMPALRYLRFSASFRCEQSQLESAIMAIPSQLTHLHLEIPSSDVNFAILSICRRLPSLESLILEGSYELGSVSGQAIMELGIHCPNITHFELISLKSVTVIGFEPSSIIQLRSMHKLEVLRVMYQDSVLLFLPNLLRTHATLRQVVLWHRKHWFANGHWAELETIVTSIREGFPHVQVSLEEFKYEH